MEFKGTKDWRLHYEEVDIDNSTPRFTILGQGEELNICCSEYGIHSANHVNEFKANAKLIAAAPELLEACQLMIMDLEERGKNMQGDAVRIMKDAIKKALGGE